VATAAPEYPPTPQPILYPLDTTCWGLDCFPTDPGFGDLVGQILGDIATDADGFPEILTDLIAAYDAFGAFLLVSVLAPGLAVPPSPTPPSAPSLTPLVEFLVSLGNDVLVGQGITAQVDALLGVVSGGAPPAAGTGGMAPTAGLTTAYPCSGTYTVPAPDSITLPATFTIQLTNGGAAAVTITQYGLVEDSSQPFAVDSDITGPIPPGGAANFAVTWEKSWKGADPVQLQVWTGGTAPAVVICFALPGATPPPTGGGGKPTGGGGGGGGTGIYVCFGSLEECTRVA
jgi:hypothetical protein